MIKIAAREQHPVNHPEFEQLGPDILVSASPPSGARGSCARRTRSSCRMARSIGSGLKWTGMLDRSPCGTGTCAVMAQLHAASSPSARSLDESIIGTTFHGRLLAETVLPLRPAHPRRRGCGVTGAGRPATLPGRAWITQHATVVCDQPTPFQRAMLWAISGEK